MTSLTPPPAASCPEADLWKRLLGDELDDPQRQALEYHLDECGNCRALLDSIGGAWTLDIPLSPDPVPAMGPATAAAMARIRATPPLELAARFRDLGPDVQAPFPPIPGLSDPVVVGQGGMGIVYRARQEALDRVVAVKVLSNGSFHPSHRGRAVREAVAMARMRHPNIVQLHGAGEVEGLPFLVMEWVDGGTLQQVVNRGPLPFREAVSLILPVARAIGEAHARGVVHRDLKPSNVLLAPSPEGGPAVPKLADFGLALWRTDDPGLTETGLVIGTPSYMAPEQTGLDPSLGGVGPATDIHGLGALLHAILTGRAPYQGETTWESLSRAARGEYPPLRSTQPSLPRDVESVVARCLSTAPDQRYPSAAALVDDLERLLDGRPVAARPVSLPVRMIKWSRRHPSLATAAALVVVLGIAGLAGAIYHVRMLDRSFRALQLEQARTQKALNASDHARLRAFQALGTLHEEVIVRFLGSEPTLDRHGRTLLATVVSLYGELGSAATESRPGMVRLHGEAMLRRAQILDRLDQHDEADQAFARAVAAFDRALKQPMNGSEREPLSVRRHAAVFAWFEFLSRIGRLDKADEVASILRNDHDLPHASDRSGMVAVIGRGADNLVAKGQLEAAERAYHEAQKLAEAIRVETPNEPMLVGHVTTTMEHRANNLLHLGRRDEAIEILQQLVALGESGPKDGPGWLRFADAVRRGTAALALIRGQMGQTEEAVTLLRRKLEIGRRLIASFPIEPSYRRDQILTTKSLLQAARTLRQPEMAEAEVREAIEVARQLARFGTPSFASHFEYCKIIGDLGDLFHETGRLAEAIAQFQLALDVIVPWTVCSLEPAAVEHAAYLHRNMANLHARLGQDAEEKRHAAIDAMLIVGEKLSSVSK
ncbi:MAG: serine/threonine-protein kinase [Isosphaeraceae bacterium]